MTVSADGGRRYAVLDVHQHISANGADDAREQAARIAFMDRFGIDQACVAPPNLAVRTVSSSELNRRVAAYARALPARFPFALGSIEVRGGDAELQALEEFPSFGLSGVIWHHMFQGAFIEDPRMTPALEYCQRTGLPAFVHVMAGSLLEAPWRLGRLCERYPRVTFVALDALSTPHHADWSIEVARHAPNLYVDTGVLSSYGNPVEKFADAVGPERLLLGTDLEMTPKSFSFPHAVYEVLHSSLSPEAKEGVLGGNARRLLSRPPRGQAAPA